MTETPHPEQAPQPTHPDPQGHTDHSGASAQPAHQAQPGYAVQPGYPAQPGYSGQPGYSAQDRYSAQPQQQPEQQPQHTQPTVQLPDTGSQAHYVPPQRPSYASHPDHLAEAASSASAGTAAGASAATAAPTAPTQSKSRAGIFFAGIAIGAVVAGIVGGGAGALVAANQQTTSVVQSPTTGRVTLDNLDTATSVSAVALAATPSVVTLEVAGSNGAGSGSGVIYNEDGYIVTNAHVVTLDGAAGSNPDIRVWLSDGRILDGTLVGTDPFADLAVVKVEADNLIPIKTADPEKINVGDLTVAIGAPLNLSNTVTSGVVSALNRGIAVGSPIVPDQPNEQQDQPEPNEGFPWYRFGDPNEGQKRQQQEVPRATATQVTLPVIQTDASINPGNSGGALLNANAELIGINVAIASNGSDSSTAGSDGLGFAIPVNMVTRVADAIIAGEQPSHGLLGIGVNDSSADTDADRNFAGGLISEIVAGGPAAKAGLKIGDVITAVDGIPADSGTSVSALIRMQEGGEEVAITYTRNGERGETNVTLGTLEW